MVWRKLINHQLITDCGGKSSDLTELRMVNDSKKSLIMKALTTHLTFYMILAVKLKSGGLKKLTTNYYFSYP